MLFTRCPDCDTTFRITDEALKKANGQVRCGRCASVFNAYATLHETSAAPTTTLGEPRNPPAPPVEAASAAAPATAPHARAATPAANVEAKAPPAPPAPSIASEARPERPASRIEPSTHPTSPAPASGPTPAAPPTAAIAPAPPDPTAASIGATSIADVVAEVEAAAADASSTTGEAEASAELTQDATISAVEIESVLGDDTAAAAPEATQWSLLAAAQRSTPRRWWAVAVALATMTLALQVLHHYRAALAGRETLGPWLQETYALLGVTVTPNWDVHQYEILDWVATAEPNERGRGSLKITARIQNHGPLRQPYPAVHLRLKDRWEEAVGGRIFAPAEYLPRDAPSDRLMSPGETARAEIEVVDPGPDAYGFELDVCIEVEPTILSCGSDEVFL